MIRNLLGSEGVSFQDVGNCMFPARQRRREERPDSFFRDGERLDSGQPAAK
jgi:hypothetical protein